MADKTVTVKSSGGDYTSLNAALSGESVDLVTNTRILTIDCYNFADTTIVDTGAGYTTSSSYYIKMQAHDSHGGKWNTSIYRNTQTAAGASITINVDYIVIEGIQVQVDSSNSTAFTLSNNARASGANEIKFISCIAKGPGGTAGGLGFGCSNFQADNAKIICINCIAYDFKAAGSGFGFAPRPYYGFVYLYNCTAQNCLTGYGCTSNGTRVRKNCGASGCTAATSGTWTDTTCSDSDPTFVDSAGDDFHLASGDTTWKDQGTDLSGDAVYAFSIDIDGETRSGTWDIGADEYVSAFKPFRRFNIMVRLCVAGISLLGGFLYAVRQDVRRRICEHERIDSSRERDRPYPIRVVGCNGAA